MGMKLFILLVLIFSPAFATEPSFPYCSDFPHMNFNWEEQLMYRWGGGSAPVSGKYSAIFLNVNEIPKGNPIFFYANRELKGKPLYQINAEGLWKGKKQVCKTSFQEGHKRKMGRYYLQSVYTPHDKIQPHEYCRRLGSVPSKEAHGYCGINCLKDSSYNDKEPIFFIESRKGDIFKTSYNNEDLYFNFQEIKSLSPFFVWSGKIQFQKYIKNHPNFNIFFSMFKDCIESNNPKCLRKFVPKGIFKAIQNKNWDDYFEIPSIFEVETGIAKFGKGHYVIKDGEKVLITRGELIRHNISPEQLFKSVWKQISQCINLNEADFSDRSDEYKGKKSQFVEFRTNTFSYSLDFAFCAFSKDEKDNRWFFSRLELVE
mgnify:CR=1 FL=1